MEALAGGPESVLERLLDRALGGRDDGCGDQRFPGRSVAGSLGSPLTDKARMTERFRRVNYGTLEIELSVNDPKAYTRPWTVKLSQSIVLNSDLMDWICLENERDFPHLVGK